MAGNLLEVDLGEAIKAGGEIVDDLFTSDEERIKLELQEKEIEAKLLSDQSDVNKIEAQHKSIFVSGWRPFVGWIAGLSIGYKFLIYPLIVWVWAFCQAKAWIPGDIKPPPTINAAELYPIITGMLGLSGMRTYEGIKGVKTNSLQSSENKIKSWYQFWK